MEDLRKKIKEVVPACDVELTDDQLEVCVAKALSDIEAHKGLSDLTIENLDDKEKEVLNQGALALGIYRTMIEYALKRMEIEGEQVHVEIDPTTSALAKLYNEYVDKFNSMLEEIPEKE